VQSPKYTTLEKVITLQLGMSKTQVEEHLGVKPYDLKAYTDSSNVFIYVYRTEDRKTLSFFTKPLNGHKSTGKYVQLEISYSKKDKVTNIYSCNLCPDSLASTSKIDLSQVFIFVTVTLPVILIYIGLRKS
jgi:outer membrane protein assembly factor BamE (lipoprotein component of BamABCDE complex)